jgi:hypothetical protein
MTGTQLKTAAGFLVAACLFMALSVSGASAQTMTEPAWPRRIEVPEGTVVIYQPQLDSFRGDMLTGRAAISVQLQGAAEPVFGAMWFNARVSTDRDNRLVTFEELNITKIHFADAGAAREDEVKQIILAGVKDWDTTISLDRVLAALRLTEQEKMASTALMNNPPKIVFSDTPAVLVSIDGEPKLEPVEGATLMRVVNTPFLIAYDTATRDYYLRSGEDWVTAKAVTGPWADIQTVPDSVDKLFADAQPTAPAEETEQGEASAKPRIVVATSPTELIVTDGQPEFQTIFGTDLLYVANTTSNVFVDTSTQDMYLLLSGRWFRSKTMKGPFAYVPSGELPADFAKIPAGSPKSDVLAFVAGTDEAEEAVMDTQIPQTAAIKKADAQLTVQYDGAPEFTPIEGTRLAYAANTTNEVVYAPPNYYCCQDGVWFQASAAAGPWTICTSIPTEIYTIPPSCPLYNVTYVRIFDSTPDVVYVGYYPGYLGCYVYGDTIVWGTGYVYPSWYGRRYNSWPHTYGCAAVYNPYTCSWGFDFGFDGCWLGIGGWWSTRDWWGVGGYRHADWDWRRHERRERFRREGGFTRGRGEGEFERGGERPRGGGFGGEERTGPGREGRGEGEDRIGRGRGENIYERRGDVIAGGRRGRRSREGPSTIEQPTVTPEPGRERPERGLPGSEAPRREPPGREPSAQIVTEPSRGEFGGRRERPPRNDVVTNREGEVYRRSLEGWQRRENKSWSQEDTGRQQQRELDREIKARNRGESRTRSFEEFRNSAPSIERSAPSRGASGGDERGGPGGEIRGGVERGGGGEMRGGEERSGGGGRGGRGGGRR